ncbi:biotin--[acetyl-CoA-carboxylase] ligase [Butyrivibrio proteoclasticus]|uniref:biotin--[acetyl-CoA-carboxylase] ligase n=1 Tax=Butyrivibrio proteoclasticus TaxID=43305 RepID=UPI00054EC5FC|nr:biotin--[acetyl-CoA-carboxylase] ligase [Butyrivibrio proteoclasticus]
MSSKEKVLELLEKNRGEYISGEAMAEKLGFSRNAIWKAINELRKAGYDVEAVSKRGYMLSTGNDIISAQGIISYLDSSFDSNIGSDKLAEHIRVYDTVDSTNKVAKEMAIKGASHGTLVVAKTQDGGRGRKDHSFFSPEGGIYMSVILSPERLQSLEPDVITTHTGEAVRDSIKELCGVASVIKPINDLFVNGKKICGILTEAGQEFDSGLVQWIVVGIGINFDSNVSSFPKELRTIVTSVFEPGKATVTKNQLIAEIYKRILERQ